MSELGAFVKSVGGKKNHLFPFLTFKLCLYSIFIELQMDRDCVATCSVNLACWPWTYLKSEVNSGTQILSSGHTKAEAAVAFLGVQWGWGGSRTAVLWFSLTIVVSAIEPKLLMKMLQLTFTGGPAWKIQIGTVLHWELISQKISILQS